MNGKYTRTDKEFQQGKPIYEGDNGQLLAFKDVWMFQDREGSFLAEVSASPNSEYLLYPESGQGYVLAGFDGSFGIYSDVPVLCSGTFR